jgi:NAD(P)-dependent dehydrogenase (short-subunit alcohol dehydrogenase family)
VAPHIAERGGGRIINMSCFAALSVGSAIGSIRNEGVAALTKNLAHELAPSGISVVCAHPGRTRTEGPPSSSTSEAAQHHLSTASHCHF